MTEASWLNCIRKLVAGCLSASIAFAARGGLAAALTGPTLHLDYGHGQALHNPVSQFMYFVPLISPEPVAA
jgi:hypothetical protein